MSPFSANSANSAASCGRKIHQNIPRKHSPLYRKPSRSRTSGTTRKAAVELGWVRNGLEWFWMRLNRSVSFQNVWNDKYISKTRYGVKLVGLGWVRNGLEWFWMRLNRSVSFQNVWNDKYISKTRYGVKLVKTGLGWVRNGLEWFWIGLNRSVSFQDVWNDEYTSKTR